MQFSSFVSMFITLELAKASEKKILLKAMANNIHSHIREVVIDSKNMRREIDSERMKKKIQQRENKRLTDNSVKQANV